MFTSELSGRMARLFFAFIFVDPPDVDEWQLTQPPSALRVSAYILVAPSLVGHRLHKFRLRLTTASVCRLEDCSRRLPSTQSRHLHSARLHSGFRRYGSAPRLQTSHTLHSNAFSRHRSFLTVSGAFPLRYVRQPSLTFPSREDRPPISVRQSERAAIRQHPPTR